MDFDVLRRGVPCPFLQNLAHVQATDLTCRFLRERLLVTPAGLCRDGIPLFHRQTTEILARCDIWFLDSIPFYKTISGRVWLHMRVERFAQFEIQCMASSHPLSAAQQTGDDGVHRC